MPSKNRLAKVRGVPFASEPGDEDSSWRRPNGGWRAEGHACLRIRYGARFFVEAPVFDTLISRNSPPPHDVVSAFARSFYVAAFKHDRIKLERRASGKDVNTGSLKLKSNSPPKQKLHHRPGLAPSSPLCSQKFHDPVRKPDRTAA